MRSKQKRVKNFLLVNMDLNVTGRIQNMYPIVHSSSCCLIDKLKLAQYYHPPKPTTSTKSTPKKEHITKKKEIPVCSFLESGWCHKWSHIKAPYANPNHPHGITRCPYLDTIDKAGKYVTFIYYLYYLLSHICSHCIFASVFASVSLFAFRFSLED